MLMAYERIARALSKRKPIAILESTHEKTREGD
jgi:hypothetical protein